MDSKEFIEQLNNENRAFYNDPKGRGAIAHLSQTFPYHWIYIAELIQNAIDVGAKKLLFRVLDDKTLLFEHDGKIFDKDDVYGLCTRGVSTKSTKTIGFMGVGFKSVFKSFEKIWVSSGPWKFFLQVPVEQGLFGAFQREWLGCVLPLCDETIPDPSAGMTCSFRLSYRLDGIGTITDDLREVLQEDMSLLPLLAMNGVEELLWDERSFLLTISEPEACGERCARMKVEAMDTNDQTAPVFQWQLFAKEYIPSEQARKRFLEHRELTTERPEELKEIEQDVSKPRQVQIFCPLDGKGIPTLPKRGRAFAVLPTQVFFPIRINIQADWLLDISRRGLMDDLKNDSDAKKKNFWHEEIFDQLPSLVRAFLAWLVSSDGPSEKGWWSGYEIIPDFQIAEPQFEWPKKEQLQTRFHEELFELSFLPSLVKDGIKFISPKESYFLPRCFDALISDEFVPWRLFGPDIISLTLLGKQPFSSLQNLNLLQEINSSELAFRWRDGAISGWLSEWPTQDERKNIVILFFSCLNDLGNSWDMKELECIPSETWNWDDCSGEWMSLKIAKRLPGDWQILNQEPDIAGTLKPYAGKNNQLLNSTIYFHIMSRIGREGSSAIQQMAWKFVKSVPETSLESMVEAWWRDLETKKLGKVERELIIRFTRWIREKQSARRNLVKRVLARNSKGTVSLVEPEIALLSAPYAGGYRRKLFPEVPVIVNDYSDDASLDDWKAFFNSLDPRPKGGFQVKLSLTKISEDRAREKFGPNTWLRVSDLSLSWRGFLIDNASFYLLDGELPVLKNIEGDYEKARHFVQWLEESPSRLSQDYSKVIAYIPYNNGYVSDRKIDEVMTWVTELSHSEWVPGSDRRCYEPAQILYGPDPLRPDVPYAHMTEELYEALSTIGIKLGSEVPKAPALARFMAQAPSADPGRVIELLEETIRDIGNDPSEIGLLKDTLLHEALIPLPGLAQTPDRVDRISFDRIVDQAGAGGHRRSDLMGWVGSKDKYNSESAVLSLIETIEKFTGVTVPPTTTFTQALSFLKWAWTNKPPADQVRTYLSAAYSYIDQDKDLERERTFAWLEAIKVCNVYTSQKRWVSVSEAYYDDMQQAGLLKLVPHIEIATKGHLGTDADSTGRIAHLIGLTFLSDRITILPIYGEDHPLPSTWNDNFDRLVDVVEKYLEISNEDDEDAGSISRISIRRVRDIRTEIYDNSVKIHERNDFCYYDRQRNEIMVRGDLHDFAPELCKVLVTVWGLSRRGEVVGEIAPMIFLLEAPIKFSAGLRRVREFFGLDEGWPSERRGFQVDQNKPEPDEREREAQTTQKENQTAVTEATRKKEALRGQSGVTTQTPHTAAQGVRGVSDRGQKEDGDIIGKSEQLADAYTKSHEETKHEHANGPPEDEQLEKKRRVNRIVTYVFPFEAEDEDETLRKTDPEKYEHNLKIGQTAEQRVMRYEEENRRSPFQMPRNNPGYDIESYGPTDEDVKYIEVKGIDGPWTEIGVGITSRQYQEAREKGDLFWLYVVEDVFSDKPNIHRFQNPVAGIGSYRFDPNWRKLSLEETPSNKTDLPCLEPGSLVRVDGKQATIVDLQNRGELTKTTVRFEDGSESTLVNLSKISPII